MASKKEQIKFLRAFRKFEAKYPKFSIELDGEYTNGFSYKTKDGHWEDFDEKIIKNYAYNKKAKELFKNFALINEV